MALSMNQEKLGNWIGGAASAPKSGKYLENKNPSTGETYSLIPDSGAEDIEAAVAAAKNMFPYWSSRTREQRAKVLYSIADYIDKYAEELAIAETRDQGKPLALAKELEIPRAAANFRFFAGAILHDHDDAFHDDAKKVLNYTHRTPLGVAGLISPWNLPLYLLTWKIAPAIATGNTCVAKPSELTPFTAYLLGEILNEAGLPHGVVNIVFGLGSTVGDALTKHRDVPLISFTGGTSTGRKILANANERFKKTSLELGGKNAAVIFADADIAEAAIATVRSSFQNQGEICLCSSRILVEEKVYAEFLTKFQRYVELLKVGDPMDRETNMGPLVSADHKKKVLDYVEVARKEGGKVLLGGDAPKFSGKLASGYFVNPTVITDVTPSCRIMQEEVFGPVVTVTPFKDEKDAIAIANGTEYGLSASVWTEDNSRAHRVAQALHTGTVWVNTWMARDLRVPFGGVKFSGLGREGGRHSLDFFTEMKTVGVKI